MNDKFQVGLAVLAVGIAFVDAILKTFPGFLTLLAFVAWMAAAVLSVARVEW